MPVRGAARADPKLLLPGLAGLCLRDESLSLHLIDDQVATLQRTLRMAPRVVIRGPLHQTHQQRRFVQTQLPQWAVEIKMRAETEAMDRPPALLAEEDLVRIGLQDLVLAVARIHDQGHQCLVELAPQGTFGGQDEILDQLLGQGAPALHRSARLDVGPECPCNTANIDATMLEETPVLDRQKAVDQIVGQVGALYQHAILVVRGVDAADQGRFQPQQIDLLCATADPGDPRGIGVHREGPPRLAAIPEGEIARMHGETPALLRPLRGS